MIIAYHLILTSSLNFFKRYQLFLQVKQDVLQGRLPVSFELAAELGAYVVQCKYNTYQLISLYYIQRLYHMRYRELLFQSVIIKTYNIK